MLTNSVCYRDETDFLKEIQTKLKESSDTKDFAYYLSKLHIDISHNNGGGVRRKRGGAGEDPQICVDSATAEDGFAVLYEYLLRKGKFEQAVVLALTTKAVPRTLPKPLSVHLNVIHSLLKRSMQSFEIHSNVVENGEITRVSEFEPTDPGNYWRSITSKEPLVKIGTDPLQNERWAIELELDKLNKASDVADDKSRAMLSQAIKVKQARLAHIIAKQHARPLEMESKTQKEKGRNTLIRTFIDQINALQQGNFLVVDFTSNGTGDELIIENIDGKIVLTFVEIDVDEDGATFTQDTPKTGSYGAINVEAVQAAFERVLAVQKGGGKSSKYRYKGRLYKIRTGVRGGRYILVNKTKVYI